MHLLLRRLVDFVLSVVCALRLDFLRPSFFSDLQRHQMSNRAAKATLFAAVAFSSLTIWAVHHQQQQEREVTTSLIGAVHSTQRFQTMYQGVLKDDQRRQEKMRQREENLKASQQKRELYEKVQAVSKVEGS